MKKVLVFGVFDMLHFGHLRLLKRAAKLGDYLIVAVQEDDCILRYKPKGAAGTLYSTEERMEMLRALRVVDEVITYQNVAEDIQKIDFDIYVKGPDQSHPGFQKSVNFCEEKGKDIVVLPRTEGISTTYLKRMLNDFAAKEEGEDING